MKFMQGFLSGRVAAAGAAVVLWSGCAGDPGREAPPPGGGASFGAGYPPGSAAWSDGARSAYRTAFMAGMQDQKEGYRYDDDRGAQMLEVEERGFYRQGYRRGYYHEANVRRQERREGAAEDKVGENSPDQAAVAREIAKGSGFSSTAIKPLAWKQSGSGSGG